MLISNTDFMCIYVLLYTNNVSLSSGTLKKPVNISLQVFLFNWPSVLWIGPVYFSIAWLFRNLINCLLFPVNRCI